MKRVCGRKVSDTVYATSRSTERWRSAATSISSSRQAEKARAQQELHGLAVPEGSGRYELDHLAAHERRGAGHGDAVLRDRKRRSHGRGIQRLVRDEGDRFRAYFPQELGHYVAEVVLDAIDGLDNR